MQLPFSILSWTFFDTNSARTTSAGDDITMTSPPASLEWSTRLLEESGGINVVKAVVSFAHVCWSGLWWSKQALAVLACFLRVRSYRQRWDMLSSVIFNSSLLSVVLTVKTDWCCCHYLSFDSCAHPVAEIWLFVSLGWIVQCIGCISGRASVEAWKIQCIPCTCCTW